MTHTPIRFVLTIALALAAAVVLVLNAGCASVLGPRSVELSQEQLLAALAQRFPFNTRALGVFDIVAATPRLKMLPESNRVATEFDLGTTDRLMGQVFKMTLGASYGLRVEPSDQTVRLTDLRIEGLKLGDLPVSLQGPMSGAVTRMAEGLMRDAVVYRLKPEELQTAGRIGYQPGPITVRPGGLSLQLVPKS